MSTQDLHELMALKGFQKKSISVLSDTGNSTLTSLGNHVEKDSAKLKLKALEHGRMKKEMAKENEMMMKEKERNNDKDKESSLGNVAVTVMGTQELKLKLKTFWPGAKLIPSLTKSFPNPAWAELPYFSSDQ